MSDFLLLRDINRCPKCFVRREKHNGNCHNCGLRLFMDDAVNFSRFEEETGIMNWWAWSGIEEGWKHRDFYMIESARPQVKRYEIEKLPENYGRQTTPQEVANRRAQTVRIKNRA